MSLISLVTEYDCLYVIVQVAIENPWVRILENMPDTLARKRYAT